MKAAFLTDIRTIELRDIPEPQAHKPGDCRLKVETVGVCGSDMHYYRTGRIGDQVVEFPWLVGHECSARVLEVNGPTDRVKVGDRVAVDPLIWCHQCDQCKAGRVHTCRKQVFLGCPGQLPGCLAEQIVMPADSLFAVPADMSLTRAALVEPFSIGLYAQKLAGESLAGMNVGILGSGPIGLCVAQACKAAGAERIFMTEIRPERVEIARRMGADWTGNPRESDVVADMLTEVPQGLDRVFECAGEQETLDQGIALARPGGMLLVVGIPEVDRISFEMATMRRHEITVQPVRRQNHCVEEAIDMVRAGRVDLDPMVTHEFTLGQTQQAFDLVADYKDGAIKAMIHLGE